MFPILLSKEVFDVPDFYIHILICKSSSKRDIQRLFHHSIILRIVSIQHYGIIP